MKHLLLLAGMLALLCRANAQTPSDYKERSAGDTLLPPAEWTQTLKTWRVGWGNTDTHYEKFDIAPVASSPWQATAWRGEKVNAQAVLSTAEALSGVRLEASDLRSGRHTIPAATVELSFVRYVLTDSLVNDQSGCGYRTDKSQWDTLLVADVLDTRPELDIAPCTTRPLWMSVTIPANARPGTYKGTLTVTARRSNGKTLRKTLPYEIRVSTRQLPPASQWQLHLDLWQNPYAVARYYNVPLWSEAHFDLMRPLMQRLADAGQKVITTTIMQYPWNGQTEDPFESMVFKMKRIDGTWAYDYTVFDRWVEFMMSLGIDRQINCYTIVPWSLSFDYFDQGSNTVRYLKAPIGSPEYNAYWLPFLRDFAAHLKAKGWFDRTYIALDERGMEETRNAMDMLHAADPAFKISGAAHYYPETEPRMDDLSLMFYDTIPAPVLERRRAEGKITTVYSYCGTVCPNTFMVSAPAEAACIPVYSLAAGFNGTLRWAYNSWTANPLQDARFRTWVGGDCYLVYPGASSIRFERLQEGLVLAEKIRLLREEYTRTRNTEALHLLNEEVARFVRQPITHANTAPMVNRLRAFINGL